MAGGLTNSRNPLMPVAMRARTRLKLGIAFILGGNLLFFTSAWIAWMPWPASVKATLWSILFFPPEVGTLIGAAVMGKENYEWFRLKAAALLRRIKPAGDVSLGRHRTGLAMLFAPLVPAYLQAFKPEWLPDHSPVRWQAMVAAHLLCLGGLFVLGGDFWDKLHALFSHTARAASLPVEEAANTPAESAQAPR